MTKTKDAVAATRIVRILSGILFLAIVSACSTGSGRNGFGFETGGMLISEEREQALGAQEHPKIVAAFGGAYQDPRLQTGLKKIVDRLARVSPRPDIDYSITVLNTPTVNAFALPGGFLYVTRGLLTLANDEDEVAAVLAHEMGHISSRHAVKRENQSSSVVLIGQVVRDMLRNPGRAASAMTDARANVAKFSRQQEFEADQIGLETAVKAGFDPFGASSFLTSMRRNNNYRNKLLAKGEATGHGADFLATHPSTPERISRVTQLSRGFGFDKSDRPRSRTAYLDMIDGMMFGNDPSEGFVRDRLFIHPQLRFEFKVAPGFTIQNTADAVFALGPDGSALRFDAVDVPEDQLLSQYVTRVWAKGIVVRDLRTDRLGNMSVVMGRASHGDWEYRLAAVRVEGRRTFRFLMAARSIDAAADRGFENSVRSLRMLSVEEAGHVRPLRVRIVTVGPGENASAMASRMAIKEDALDYFRVLNGLESNDTVQPGQRVKIVADQ